MQVVALLEEKFAQHVPELAGVPVLPVSALTGSGTGALMPAVMRAYDIWQQRIPTSRLNRWLEKVRNECERNSGNPATLSGTIIVEQVPASDASWTSCVGACALACVCPLPVWPAALDDGAGLAMPGGRPGDALGACTKVMHRLVLVSSKTKVVIPDASCSVLQLVVQYMGTGGTAKELAKIRYITQVA